ncbi:MAG: alanine racemase [Planktomarina sp.]
MSTGQLTINLDAIAANWTTLDNLSSQRVETAAVVKADGYGLGAPQVGRALYDAGARTFFVAAAEEAVALRDALGGEVNICIFSGHMSGDTDLILDLGLIPMINSIDQLTRHFETLSGHTYGVQLDTGMNRLGMERAEWAAVIETIMQMPPWLVISHLACSDEPNHPMNLAQLAEFKAMTDGLGIRRSLAATGGTLLGPEYHFDMTRPGIGTYGAAPLADAFPTVHLSLPVIQTRDVAAGETVGYGGSWTASAPARIATVAAGYADGLIRAMSNNSNLWCGDIPCPIVGRVSMDMIGVDVTHLDELPTALDIVCPHQSVDDLADAAGTIGYEILTSMGTRYTRRYLSQ